MSRSGRSRSGPRAARWSVCPFLPLVVGVDINQPMNRPAEATGGVTAASVDPRYARFIELFNRAEFWESHEALEDVWRETGSEFYHALILYASAFVHVKRGNRHGIAAQLSKAEPLFEPRRPTYLGLDVDAILEHSTVCRHLVAENQDAPGVAWEVLIPFPRLVFGPDRLRGDEPELRSHGNAPPPAD